PSIPRPRPPTPSASHARRRPPRPCCLHPVRNLSPLGFEGNMARLVSSSLVRGLVRSCRAPSTATVSRPTFQQFMTYSSGISGDSNANGGTSATRVTADTDTHQDFQPTSKGSDMSLQDIVAQDIKENPVIIFMKGYPEAPRCGFSALAVKVLQQYGVSITARDILSNMKLKESVKAHSNWPTFPQIFINGEFVGGSDIILSMHQ
uniref:Glutaredoxin domain-containing protein n=3 Tax=Triticinae TaxID=1648030 RepID=A0A453EB19_AEGTS